MPEAELDGKKKKKKTEITLIREREGERLVIQGNAKPTHGQCNTLHIIQLQEISPLVQ